MSKTLRTVGQNTGILFFVNIFNAVAGFAMAAILGRGLGDAGFGQYNLVFTWLLSFMLLAEFGLSTTLTRDLAASPQQTPSYLFNTLLIKALLGIPLTIILLIFAPQLATNQNPDVVAALRWGILFIYSGLFYSTFTAIFKAGQRMLPILWLTLAGQIVLVAGTAFLILNQQPLFTIVAWAGLSQTGQCLAGFIALKRLLPYPKLSQSGWRFDWAAISQLIRRTWPFALAGFLAILQFRANVLILAYLQGDQALGWYAAANRFLEVGKQLPGAFYVAILPAMAALAAGRSQQRTELQHTFRQAQWGLLGFGLLASLGALLLARPVIYITYGPGYEGAVTILQILTVSLIPATQNSLLVIFLYACNDEKFVNLLLAAGIVLNLSLCFWLIPLWSGNGTALALLLTESVLYFAYRFRVRRILTGR